MAEITEGRRVMRQAAAIDILTRTMQAMFTVNYRAAHWYQRTQINPATLRLASGIESAIIKAFVEANAAEIAAHNNRYCTQPGKTETSPQFNRAARKAAREAGETHFLKVSVKGSFAIVTEKECLK